MKAILGNFKKISETEFHLKKNMQFAQVLLDDDGKVQTIRYEDKQNIQVDDILNHDSIDYEIKSISADDFNKLVVTVAKMDQPEQDVPDKTTFVPRKMTRRVVKPKQSVPIPPKPNLPEELVAKVEEKILEATPEKVVIKKDLPKAEPIITKPKNRNIFKRFAGWISSKLSKYSNS
jgi:hypothetical protein